MDGHVLPEMQRVMKKAIASNGVDKVLAANHGDVRAGVGQHAAEISAHSARADYSDARPILLFRHS
jgi:hypothetical protein